MKMKLLFILLCGVIPIIGCDASGVMELPRDPNLVIAPGFKIDLSGQKTLIQGFDECPVEKLAISNRLGQGVPDSLHNCIVISESRETVPVLVFLPTGSALEEWKIIREKGITDHGKDYIRTSLRRPDGSSVIPATH